jgi:hypothetical protein
MWLMGSSDHQNGNEATPELMDHLAGHQQHAHCMRATLAHTQHLAPPPEA